MTSMREPTYFILASLLDGRRHGYGIAQEAVALSGGRVRLTAGTLYGALERLVADLLVEVDGEDVVNGRRRRYYRLSSAGERALADEAERLSSSAKVVTQRLAGLQRLRARVHGA